MKFLERRPGKYTFLKSSYFAGFKIMKKIGISFCLTFVKNVKQTNIISFVVCSTLRAETFMKIFRKQLLNPSDSF